MGLYQLTRNQAFPDLNGKVGQTIEIDNPESDEWKPLIDAKILVPTKDKAVEPAEAEKTVEAPTLPTTGASGSTTPAEEAPDATLARALGETAPAGGKPKTQ